MVRCWRVSYACTPEAAMGDRITRHAVDGTAVELLRGRQDLTVGGGRRLKRREVEGSAIYYPDGRLQSTKKSVVTLIRRCGGPGDRILT